MVQFLSRGKNKQSHHILAIPVTMNETKLLTTAVLFARTISNSNKYN